MLTWILLASLPKASLAEDDAGALVQMQMEVAAARLQDQDAKLLNAADGASALSVRRGMGMERETEDEMMATIFDIDLGADPVKRGMIPLGPEKAEELMQLTRDYVATAVDFSQGVTAVSANLSNVRAVVQSPREVRAELKAAFATICAKAQGFERGFNHSLGASMDAMPLPKTEMAERQLDKVKGQMHDFVAPLLEIAEALQREESSSQVCSLLQSQLSDLQKHGRALVVMNRQQVVGSQALLANMPAQWQPYVNVSLVKELGSMATETADAVQIALKHISGDVGGFMRDRLNCTSWAYRYTQYAWMVLASLMLSLRPAVWF